MLNANLFRKGINPRTSEAPGTHGISDSQATESHGNATTDAEAPSLKLISNTDQDHFIRKDGKVFAGTHLLIEVVRGSGLDDADRIERAFRKCVEVCGATLLHIHLHKFSPQGVSGVAVLAESHISVHTWPEIGYGAFDVFMCGDAEPWKAVDILAQAFDTQDVRVTEKLRGEGIVDEMMPAGMEAAA